MAGLNKKLNEYAQQVDLYDQCPKAVFAAIAVSVMTCGGDWIEQANEKILEEWWALYHAGVVPQKPPGADPSACEHEWVSLKNQVIESGEYCPKCNAIRGASCRPDIRAPWSRANS